MWTVWNSPHAHALRTLLGAHCLTHVKHTGCGKCHRPTRWPELSSHHGAKGVTRTVRYAYHTRIHTCVGSLRNHLTPTMVQKSTPNVSTKTPHLAGGTGTNTGRLQRISTHLHDLEDAALAVFRRERVLKAIGVQFDLLTIAILRQLVQQRIAHHLRGLPVRCEAKL